MPLRKKAKYADYLVDSREPLSGMETRIRQIFEDLKQLSAPNS
jgi:hypothetical protein